jgi:hypothetical protein
LIQLTRSGSEADLFARRPSRGSAGLVLIAAGMPLLVAGLAIPWSVG